jgi:spermidine synthase
MEVPLEVTNDPYYLELILSKNRIVLNSQNANQSNGDLRLAFEETYKYLNFSQMKASNVLILGFGIGSILKDLQSHFGTIEIDAIENNNQIVEWFYKYYPLDNIKIHHQSAADLNTINCKAFDVVILDLFIDHHIPEFVYETSFFETLNSLLSDNGILIWNTLPANQSKISLKLKELFDEPFETQFGNLMYLKRKKMDTEFF